MLWILKDIVNAKHLTLCSAPRLLSKCHLLLCIQPYCQWSSALWSRSRTWLDFSLVLHSSLPLAQRLMTGTCWYQSNQLSAWLWLLAGINHVCLLLLWIDVGQSPKQLAPSVIEALVTPVWVQRLNLLERLGDDVHHCVAIKPFVILASYDLLVDNRMSSSLDMHKFITLVLNATHGNGNRNTWKAWKLCLAWLWIDSNQSLQPNCSKCNIWKLCTCSDQRWQDKFQFLIWRFLKNLPL